MSNHSDCPGYSEAVMAIHGKHISIQDFPRNILEITLLAELPVQASAFLFVVDFNEVHGCHMM